MKDHHLLIGALITGILGIIVLFFLSKIMELQVSTLGDVKELENYEDVRIFGVTEKITKGRGFTKFRISSKEYLDVTVFHEVNLTKGQEVEVIGKVSEYRGSKGLIASKIISKG